MDFYKNNKEWIIPVTILVVGKTIDFVLPWLRSYAENKYLSYQERRISILITRYREISVMDPKNWTLPVGVEWRTRKEVQDGKETQEFRCGVQDESCA